MSDNLIEHLINKAKRNPKRVALPECEAPKTLLAARKILDLGIGFPVLVNDPALIKHTASEAGVSLEGMEIADITVESLQDLMISKYLAESRELSEKACKRKTRNPIHYAMMMNAIGTVDCVFCGHTNTTGDVLLAGLDIIGLKEGVDIASIFALVETPTFKGPEGNRVAFADCALTPEPTASQLASIAIATSDSVRALMGWEPRVGFLSYSTLGSGSGSTINKIQEALEILKERRPDIKADGEFQLDAAIDPKVAATKVKRPSEVAGKANILIFPDLNAANIGIKIIQNFALGKAYGHTLSGFRKPIADSSRGATVDEMVGDIAMVVIAASGNI